MDSYSIALSALSVSQRAMDLVGQNIANASTPGYHRQVMALAPRVVGGSQGLGVDVQFIQRYTSEVLERSKTVNIYQTARASAELQAMQQIESLYTPGAGTLTDLTSKLFNQLDQLASQPDSTAQRRVVLGTANNLATELNRLSRGLTQIKDDLRNRVDEGVTQINLYSKQIADLNQRIQITLTSGQTANELLDQRDQMINDLAKLVDVRIIDQPNGVTNVLAGSAPLVVGSQSTKLVSSVDATGQLYVAMENTTTPVGLTSGALVGQIHVHNQIVTNYNPRLDAFAQALSSELDSVQATGLGLVDPQSSALGVRSVVSTTAPLANAGTALPIQAGAIYFSLTNQATGQRTLTQVNVDPASQSLQDLANSITASTGGRLQATITSDNRLQLQAQAGYTFDNAGRSPTELQNSTIGGTAVPVVQGIYTGKENGSYTFQVVGSGTVGVTANLQIVVRDVSNNLVSTVNIGQGYTPGTPISIGNGLTIRIAAGSISAGGFSVPVLATPDTSGALAALGINTIFQGSDAGSLRVRSDIRENPALLAASRDGQPGDNSNLLRMTALQSKKVLDGGTDTFLENLSGMIGEVGAAVRSRSDEQLALKALGQNIHTQQQAISGVDPNEEVATLLQFQRSFQMAARFITVVNTTMDDLLNIVR